MATFDKSLFQVLFHPFWEAFSGFELPEELRLVSELVHGGANTDTPWSENLYCTAQPWPQHPMAAP